MTHRARWAAPAGVLCGLAAMTAASPATAIHVRSVTERVFPFPAGGTVSIESQNGRIVIEAWDRPEVRVQITREVRSPGQEHARAVLKDLTADVTVQPRRIRIESIYPKRQKVVGLWNWLGRGVRSMNIHYYLQVPRGTSLDLSTANGEIRVRGSQGALSAITTNGDIDVSAVRGPVKAHTTNGEIRLARIEGLADAMTTNGSVAAEVIALPARGAMAFETTNGNLALTLPREVHANIEANTTNGKIAVNYNVTSQGVVSSKQIRGAIGGGGVRIRLETTNGNIDVGPPRARRG
jgi:phage baseplate assembly protein gpV